ncbi:MAG: TetR family transcriptional regulator [Caulobacter sp.]
MDKKAPNTGRDVEHTRECILIAARRVFTERGYERAGMREVADEAGYDPALIYRYFGSKAGLLAEVLDCELDIAAAFDGDRRRFGRWFMTALTADTPHASGFDPLLIIARTGPDEDASQILRLAIRDRLVAPLSRWLGGPGAQERASMLLAVALSVEVMLEMRADDPAETFDPDLLVSLAAEVVQGLVDHRAAA